MKITDEMRAAVMGKGFDPDAIIAAVAPLIHADLVAENERLAAARGETIEKAMAICDLWLHRFEGKPVDIIPAHDFAADAVKDIRDEIAALARIEALEAENKRLAKLDT